jgi:ribonuclease HII
MLKSSYGTGLIEAGCDEAGRGCLAGPVVAAAVILPVDFYHPLLNDSKKLSARQRDEAAEIIRSSSICHAVGISNVEEIDRINILNASINAMHRALEQLVPEPEFILVDGNRFLTYREKKHECIIRGDGIFASIAAASILAKTERDRYMCNLHNAYPSYGWDRNKGYPTHLHREAIRTSGITPHHRRSFRLAGEQLRLKFS